MVIEMPIELSARDEAALLEKLTVQDARWDGAGLTVEDLAAWLPPGFPPFAVEDEALEAIEFGSGPA
jgi:hypothetical protein